MTDRTSPRPETPCASWSAMTSAVIRGAMARMLDADPAVQVVARVANGQMAIDELKRTPVDVVVLDIEMPVMDGMTALPLLLRADPGLKVIMASTLTTRGADIAIARVAAGCRGLRAEADGGAAATTCSAASWWRR